jgi:hypothetical protein
LGRHGNNAGLPVEFIPNLFQQPDNFIHLPVPAKDFAKDYEEHEEDAKPQQQVPKDIAPIHRGQFST